MRRKMQETGEVGVQPGARCADYPAVVRSRFNVGSLFAGTWQVAARGTRYATSACAALVNPTVHAWTEARSRQVKGRKAVPQRASSRAGA